MVSRRPLAPRGAPHLQSIYLLGITIGRQRFAVAIRSGDAIRQVVIANRHYSELRLRTAIVVAIRNRHLLSRLRESDSQLRTPNRRLALAV